MSLLKLLTEKVSVLSSPYKNNLILTTNKKSSLLVKKSKQDTSLIEYSVSKSISLVKKTAPIIIKGVKLCSFFVYENFIQDKEVKAKKLTFLYESYISVFYDTTVLECHYDSKSIDQQSINRAKIAHDAIRSFERKHKKYIKGMGLTKTVCSMNVNANMHFETERKIGIIISTNYMSKLRKANLKWDEINLRTSLEV